MLNFYGRRNPRNIKNDQIKNLNKFKFFLSKDKIKKLKNKIKKFDAFNLEIGFGGGENLFAQSEKKNNEFFLGCDPYLSGSFNLKKSIKAYGLKNLFFTNLDFLDLVKFLKGISFKRIIILFPDPWPKRRHKKRRLINSNFVDLLESITFDKTKIIVATDHKDYLSQILYEFYKNKLFSLSTEVIDYEVEVSFDITSTKYYKKAKKSKKKAYFLLFEKKS
ncbi:MAG: tRNA (guanosine(46)-N7)-methyltransferase TrmB [Rickettsiales bacterium]|nr:tRNA (guanosine(46)-N7)-methyltransferase TrmB [Rickettsiales bacterium]